MQKRIIPSDTSPASMPDDQWLDLERLAEVELTSEDPSYPIESAVQPRQGSGWRAAAPGPQTIRLRFAVPQRVRRIWLQFNETERPRTQEYVLRWSADNGQTFRDVVRQQWTFSPQGSNRETEDHRTDLSQVTALELQITPDVSGGDSRASLAQIRVA